MVCLIISQSADELNLLFILFLLFNGHYFVCTLQQAVQSNDEGLEKKTTKVETETSIPVERQNNVVKATRPQGRSVQLLLNFYNLHYCES